MGGSGESGDYQVKVGDVVRPRTEDKWGRNIGIVMQLHTGVFEDQIKVYWDIPTWYDPEDGLSVENPEELEIISEK